MGLNNIYATGVCVVLLSGCASINGGNKQEIYEQGYRKGVKENIKQIATQFEGGNFPYYHWTSPIVQEVNIPAHLANGVMIPEHKELVIIQPGQWSLSPAYPIQTQENRKNENQITYVDGDVSNITAMPKSTR